MSNRDPQIYVLGSINMDVVAQVDRHARPGETVRGRDLRYFPGGKGANQAVAAARAGGDVSMIGAVGDDTFAETLLNFLKSSNIDTSHVDAKSGPTGTALIVVDSAAQNSIVVVPGANGEVSTDNVEELPVAKGDVLVAQFETPAVAAEAMFKIGREHGATCILNPAPAEPIGDELLRLTDVLVVNETELGVVTGRDVTSLPSTEDIKAAQGELQSHGFDGCLVVTLGSHGSVTLIGDRRIVVEGRAVDAVDTTGAGDCFVGFLAANLASGNDIDSSLATANHAASICVQRHGAGPSMPTASELSAE